MSFRLGRDRTRGDAPIAALDGAPVWLNSEPLTAAGLRGDVVLVDFWTYSCVNWLRTPALRQGVARAVSRPVGCACSRGSGGSPTARL